MDAKDFDKIMEEVFAFRHSLSEETDRGCALMVAEYLSHELEILLRGRLVDSSDVLDKIFGTNGFLNTFSARIDMSFALGLIGKEARRDLHLIRNIRNDFGHSFEVMHFTDPPLKDRCIELYHGMVPKDKPRWRFTNVAIQLLATIHGENFNSSNIPENEDSDVAATRTKVDRFLSEVMEEARKDDADITPERIHEILSNKVSKLRSELIRNLESHHD